MFFLIPAAIVILDQVTKQLIITTLKPYEAIYVLPFFNIVHVLNTGAAFGSLQWLGNPFFIALSVIAIVVVIFLMIKDRESIWGLSFILGGAIGNLIDRFRHGYVVDFLDVFVGKYHWPAFNVADSFLSVGVFIIAIRYLFFSHGKDGVGTGS